MTPSMATSPQLERHSEIGRTCMTRGAQLSAWTWHFCLTTGRPAPIAILIWDRNSSSGRIPPPTALMCAQAGRKCWRMISCAAPPARSAASPSGAHGWVTRWTPTRCSTSACGRTCQPFRARRITAIPGNCFAAPPSIRPSLSRPPCCATVPTLRRTSGKRFYDPELPGLNGFIGNDTQIWRYDFYPPPCWRQNGSPSAPAGFSGWVSPPCDTRTNSSSVGRPPPTTGMTMAFRATSTPTTTR